VSEQEIAEKTIEPDHHASIACAVRALLNSKEPLEVRLAKIKSPSGKWQLRVVINWLK
jgi:hypothetical protein